ncbi:MAG: response regulator transcription factor [Deltaproteobacteria bacterium]|nr:response regulator transcription factor [Deltaproteobacteria bacterium]
MSIRVFIADDHPVVRDGLRALLEAERDVRVVGECADGREAVRQVKGLLPDVVIMDLGMPELNGTEATRQITEAKLGTKIVILSMHASNEHVFRALQAGAHGYLLKSSAGREVVKAVRAVHDGMRYMSERITEAVIDGYVRQDRAASATKPLDLLSPREREILQLVVEGKTSAEIAQVLFLSPKTVETYRCRFMQKLGVADLPGLVKFAIRHGLTTLDG